jgi:hypothetical protein
VKNVLGIGQECKISTATMIVWMKEFMCKVSKSLALVAYHVYTYNDLIVPK